MNAPPALRAGPNLTHELHLWSRGHECVVGLDEVGRGAWAGPVYGAAVVLPADDSRLSELLPVVRDSKQLTAAAREKALERILACARLTALGVVSSEEVDQLGVAAAMRLAWMRALACVPEPDFLLLDAFPLHESCVDQQAIIHGDSICLSIAAASIVAKVARDRRMAELAPALPGYGFERNKGYGTREHYRSLMQHGPSLEHRRSFAPVRAVLSR